MPRLWHKGRQISPSRPLLRRSCPVSNHEINLLLCAVLPGQSEAGLNIIQYVQSALGESFEVDSWVQCDDCDKWRNVHQNTALQVSCKRNPCLFRYEIDNSNVDITVAVPVLSRHRRGVSHGLVRC